MRAPAVPDATPQMIVREQRGALAAVPRAMLGLFTRIATQTPAPVGVGAQ